MGCGSSTVTPMSGSMLADALVSRDHATMEQLLAAGAKPNLYVYDKTLGRLPYLYFATVKGDLASMTILMNYGASLDQKCGDLGYTALHYAAGNISSSSTYLLLSLGANADATDKYGGTPLHVASMNGRLDCVKRLLSHGASVNAVDIFGETPLHKACEYGQEKVVRALRDAGADAHVLNEKGVTPAKLALQHGHTVCAMLLQDTPN